MIFFVKHADFNKDNNYLIVERIKFADHNNADIFFNSYASELNTINEIISYWNKKRHIVYLKEFRELLLYYYFQLLQFLFVKIKIDLNNCADFVAISKKIETLKKNFEKLQWKIKIREFELDEKNYINENVSLCSRNSANNNKFNHARLFQTQKMKSFRSQIC